MLKVYIRTTKILTIMIAGMILAVITPRSASAENADVSASVTPLGDISITLSATSAEICRSDF